MKGLLWVGGILMGLIIVGIPIAVIGAIIGSFFRKKKNPPVE